jgi:hypothetical protein
VLADVAAASVGEQERFASDLLRGAPAAFADASVVREAVAAIAMLDN